MDMEIKKVYKALIKTKEGRLVSLWAGKPPSAGKELTYEEGTITYAPKGSMGIFVEETLTGAQDNGNGIHKVAAGGSKVIYEAIPLGAKLPHTIATFSIFPRYPAILLGKKVWQDTPPRVGWEDITAKCSVELLGAHCGNVVGAVRVVLYYQGISIGAFGFGVPYVEDNYEVELCEANYLVGCGTFKVFKKVG